jgi:hypothetical protein
MRYFFRSYRRLCRALVRPFASESGHTIVEAVVALALFGAVLIPTTALTGRLFIEHSGERQIRALLLAESAMETALHHNTYQDSTWSPQEPWQIVRRSAVQDKLVHLSVEVIYGTDTAPILKLQTSRRLP